MRDRLLKFQRARVKAMVLIGLCLVLGQSLAQYEITKHTINTGGGKSTNVDESVSITGSIGQKESTTTSTGGGYRLSSGFWAAGERDETIFDNGFE